MPHPTIVSESGRAIVAQHSVLVFNVLGVSGFGDESMPKTPDAGDGTAAHRPDRDLRQPDVEERARELPRRPAGARHGDEPVLGRLPAARSAVAGREPLLGDLPEAAEAGAGDGRGARGPAEPRRVAVGHLLLQLLALPVDSRQLGDQAALSDHADPPAERAADPARRPRRHHLRLGRQDRSVHRSPRREAHAAAAQPSTARRTVSACFWSARTRRSSAICTTCSATPTPST